MKIRIVGPTHPYSGGIAQHTTRLALELEQRGHDITVESWKYQYPKRFYRGVSRLDSNSVEVGIPARVVEELSWFSPISWWYAGRRARKDDRIVLSVPSPYHSIPYGIMTLAMGRRPSRVIVWHNVKPHEPGLMDAYLSKLYKLIGDVFIVHGDRARVEATELGIKPTKLRVMALPSPWKIVKPTHSEQLSSLNQIRILFFGSIRPYKGLDLLLEAIEPLDQISLVIAGAFWAPKSDYEAQIERLGLEERVEIFDEYVPHSKFGSIFGQSDALVLPYRSGSGSIVAELALGFGVPVIATRTGDIYRDIRDGVDGLIVEAESVEALRKALKTISTPTRLEWLKRGAQERVQEANKKWNDYCEAITQ